MLPQCFWLWRLIAILPAVKLAARGVDSQMSEEVQANVGKAKGPAAGQCHIGHN